MCCAAAGSGSGSGRLERSRVRRAQREFPQSRRRSEEQVRVMQACGPSRMSPSLANSPHRGCRHQPAPGVGSGADLVRRPCRGDLPPRGEIRRRLHAAGLSGRDAALAAFEKLRRLTREAGRDPAEIGLEAGCRRARVARRTGGARSPSGKTPASPTSPRTPPMSASS